MQSNRQLLVPSVVALGVRADLKNVWHAHNLCPQSLLQHTSYQRSCFNTWWEESHLRLYKNWDSTSHEINVRPCRFAVLSGDPMQLPPLIAHPPQLTQRPGADPAHGLLRPVFVRLASMGHHVHLLRRQYRSALTPCQLPNPCLATLWGFHLVNSVGWHPVAAVKGVEGLGYKGLIAQGVPAFPLFHLASFPGPSSGREILEGPAAEGDGPLRAKHGPSLQQVAVELDRCRVGLGQVPPADSGHQQLAVLRRPTAGRLQRCGQSAAGAWPADAAVPGCARQPGLCQRLPQRLQQGRGQRHCSGAA